MKTLNFKLQLCILNFAFLIILLLPHFAEAGLIIKAPPYIGLQEGLVGFWSFDGPDMFSTKATDRSGQGNNGTLTNGPKRAIGRIGQALEFDGVDDRVALATQPAIGDISAFTITAWYKTTGTDSGTIYGEGRTTDINPVQQCYLSSGTNFSFFRRNNSGTSGSVLDSNSTNDGNWHFGVCVQYSDASREIFVDGVSRGTNTTNVGGLTLNTANIGRLNYGGGLTEAFPGLIDDVRVYNHALSEQEIKRLYNIGSTLKVNVTRKDTLTEGLLGHWSFDGPDMFSTKATDRSGQGNNGTLTNGPKRAIGRIGQALEFDGVDDHVIVPDNTPLELTGGEFTISVWTYLSSLPTGDDRRLIDKGGGTTGQGGWTIEIDGPNGRISVRINDGAQTFSNSSVLSANKWQHIIVRLSGGTIFFYVDGVAQGSGTKATPTGSSVDVHIGGRSPTSASTFLPATIDEVRVYDRALSASEIKRLYNIGSTLKVNVTRKDTLTEGLVGHWSFDGPDMFSTKATDRSGQGNNGTLTNGPKRAIGRIGQALEFDGVDGGARVQISNNSALAISGTVSVSAWIKITTLQNLRVILHKESAGQDCYQYGLEPITIDSQWHFRFVFTVNSCGAERSINATGHTIQTNQWYHVVGVRQGTAISIYVDGTLSSSATFTGTVDSETSAILTMGDKSTNQNNSAFNGLIDEVRVYNRALSADEIKRLYNMGR